MDSKHKRGTHFLIYKCEMKEKVSLNLQYLCTYLQKMFTFNINVSDFIFRLCVKKTTTHKLVIELYAFKLTSWFYRQSL